MLEYIAKFGIDCGVKSGLSTTPDYITKDFEFKASNDILAFKEAMERAEYFADNYSSNPNTGETKVTLLNFYGPNGNVKFDRTNAVAKKSGIEKVFEVLLSRTLSDDPEYRDRHEYDEEDSANIY